MNGTRIKRKWNKSIAQQERGHTSIEKKSACILSTDPFLLLCHFQDTLSIKWKKKLTKKTQKKKEENHILSCCVSIKENTGAISAILKDKINQLSSLGQLSHNGTHHQIKTTIWNRYLWADLLPMPLARWDCFPVWPRRTNEIAFISQAWYEWKTEIWSQYPAQRTSLHFSFTKSQRRWLTWLSHL